MLNKGTRLPELLKSKRTVFTVNDIALLWGESESPALRVSISYYVKRHQLFRIRKGIYSVSPDYPKDELASRIFIPSYISFETVLEREGLIFQHYSTVYLASYLTRQITVDNQSYSYRKIKDIVLTNPYGLEITGYTSIASKERAFLDTLYINKDYYFDNLRSLDWDIVDRILPMYNNKRMNKIVNRLHREATLDSR